MELIKKVKKIFKPSVRQTIEKLNKEDISLRVLGRLALNDISSTAMILAIKRHKERFE